MPIKVDYVIKAAVLFFLLIICDLIDLLKHL